MTACSASTAVETVDALTLETKIANTPKVKTEFSSTPEAGTEISISQTESLVLMSEGDLSAAEIEGLLFMREEEKLARDVYLGLYDQWNIPIFKNIATSEATHMDAILTLLTRYGLSDPAAENGIGQFKNADLQALYDQLVSQGVQSLSDALKVGAAIEEIDILDLEKYLTQTSKFDIAKVYENLTNGSRNHLRSFTRIFQQRTGEIYIPQHLSTDAFEVIVSADIESRGRGFGGRNGNGRGRGKL